MFYKTGVVKNFTKIIGKHLCWSLVFNKPFPVNFVKFFRTPFYRTPLVLLKTKACFQICYIQQQFSLMYRRFHLFKQQYTKLQQYTASENYSRFSVRYVNIKENA